MNTVTTTDHYHRDDRLLAWADQVRASCVPMAFRTESDQGFRGEISSVTTGGVCVSRISAVDHVAAHDWDDVRRTADDYLLVSIQTEGRGAIEQDARTAFVGPTDMVLFDSSRNFVWHFSGQHYTIRFPRQALEKWCRAAGSTPQCGFPRPPGYAESPRTMSRRCTERFRRTKAP